jgi:hypothetical protein
VGSTQPQHVREGFPLRFHQKLDMLSNPVPPEASSTTNRQRPPQARRSDKLSMVTVRISLIKPVCAVRICQLGLAARTVCACFARHTLQHAKRYFLVLSTVYPGNCLFRTQGKREIRCSGGTPQKPTLGDFVWPQLEPSTISGAPSALSDFSGHAKT